VSAPRLLVVNGPIASGKSTLAGVLAAELCGDSHCSVAIDLDRVYMMLDDTSPMDDSNTWREARRGAAALTNQFVQDRLELVIVEGTFWTESERTDYTNRLSTGLEPVFVTLRVALDEALRRVQQDISRRASRVPELLRRNHADFAAAGTIAGDIVVDSTHQSISEVGSTIRSALDQLNPRCAAENGCDHCSGISTA
jgi:chloramphenicol 3-O-phosphotransferase